MAPPIADRSGARYQTERRGVLRLTLHVPMQYYATPEGPQQTGLCHNLSATGICFAAKALPEPQCLFVTIPNPHPQFQPLTARIRILHTANSPEHGYLIGASIEEIL